MNTESSAAQTLCGQCFARQVQDGTCGACGTPVRPMRPKDALPLGTLLNGKFEVGNLLGDRGGFGLVYLGWDRNLRRKVVIKELLPDGLVMRQAGSTEARVVDPGQQEFFNLQREMFLDEARKLAQFDDVPAVVRVIEFFAQNDTAYFVMPYLPGRPLAARVKAEGPLSADQLLELLWPLADGLAAVHAMGILHRDIKPENVLIDDRGKPVLIDFGNAMFAGTEDTSSIGFYALSRHFAAPEQYVDDRARMGPWTDVYALCGLMFFCLTGQRPSDAAQRANSGQTTMPLRARARNVPEPLIKAIEQGLELDEKRRPRDVAALLQLLAPLRPRPFHWLQALPEGEWGDRMRRLHDRIEQGASQPPQFNARAAAFQWFWLFAYRLPGPAGLLALAVLAVAGAGMWLQQLPLGLLAALALGAAFTGAFGDLLHYRRVATLGASLQGESAEQRQHAQQALLAESRPDATRMLAGLVVPLGLAGTGLALEAHEADVRAQVERAMALGGLRERVAAYVDEHKVPPQSLADLGYEFTPDREVKKLELVAGDIHLTLAVPAVDGRKLRLRARRGADGQVAWTCEAPDLPAAYTPARCRGTP